MRQILADLGKALGPEAETRDLTTVRIADWTALASRTRNPNTIIGQLGRIRAACSYAVAEGFLERLPSFRILRPRRARPRGTRHQTAQEVRALLESLSTRAMDPGDWRSRRLHVLVAVVVYTGVRRDEALCLRWEDVDVDRGIIAIEPHHLRELKTEASAQPVPIPPELLPILAAWQPSSDPVWVCPGWRGGAPWRGGRPGCQPIDHLRRAGERVGIESLSFQSLRRSWATHAETLWGLTDPQIQRVLRHTSPETSKLHYREADLANLRSIAARVSYRSLENICVPGNG